MYSTGGGSDSVFMSDDNIHTYDNYNNDEGEDSNAEMRDLSTQTPKNRACQTPGYATTQTPRKWREKDGIEPLNTTTPQTTLEHDNNNVSQHGTGSFYPTIGTQNRINNNPQVRVNGVATLDQSLKKSLRETDYGDELPEYLQQYERYISFLDKDTTFGSTQEDPVNDNNRQNVLRLTNQGGPMLGDDGEGSPPQELTHTIAQFLRDYKSESDAGIQSEASIATTTSAQRDLLARHHFNTQDLPQPKSRGNTPVSSRTLNMTNITQNRELAPSRDTWPGMSSKLPTRSNSKSPSRTRNKSKSPSRRSPPSGSRSNTQVSPSAGRRLNSSVRSGQRLKDSSPLRRNSIRSGQSKRRNDKPTARWVDATTSQTEAPDSETTDYDESSSTLITDDDESDEKVEKRDFQMQTPKIQSTQTPGYAGTQTRDTDDDVSDIEEEIAPLKLTRANRAPAHTPTRSTQTVESRLVDLPVHSYSQTVNEAQTQTPSHSTTQTDDVTVLQQQQQQQEPQAEEKNEEDSKHKKNKHKHKSSKHKSDNQSVVSSSTRKSKKDLIRVILNEVKDLKSEVDNKIIEAGGKPRKTNGSDTTESELERIFTKSEKSKHKHKRKHRDRSKEKHKSRRDKGQDRVKEWVSDLDNNHRRHHDSPSRRHHHERSHRLHEDRRSPPRHYRGPPPPMGPPPHGPPMTPPHMTRTYPGPPPMRGPYPGPPPPRHFMPPPPHMMPPPPHLGGPHVLRPVSTPMMGNMPSPVQPVPSYVVLQDTLDSSDLDDEQRKRHGKSRPRSKNARNEINENIAMATAEANKLKQLSEKMAGSLRDALS